ncbi:MAG: hypothetical protein ACYC4Q_00560 [Victivallaceae bacterium]
MADDITRTAPLPEVQNEDFEKKLEAIEKTINRIDKIRRKQFFVTIGGMILIILVMAVFIARLADFVRNYNSQQLLEEITSNSTIITHSPELRSLSRDFQEVFIPTFKKELATSFESSMPAFKDEIFKSAKDIEVFLQQDVRNKILFRLSESLNKIEKGILSKHQDISSKELENAFNEVNTHFVEELTGVMDKRLATAKEKLVMLDETFKRFKDTAEYAEARNCNTSEIEGKLLETFLEIWIYHINPQKGMEKADVKGGK